MKYRLTILYIFFFIVVSASAIEHTYAPHSILREGHWVKIQVSETGVHQITYEELLNAGLQPDQVRIYGYGGAMLTQAFNVRKIDDLPAVPFWMEKGADGIFGKGDYILFYAQANISWSYNGVRFIHTRNPYSDYGYYFLTDNVGEQRLLNQVAASIDAEEATDVTTFANYMLHEKDLINLLDVSKGCDGGGREFYGETFQSTTGVKAFSFPANHIDVTQPMRCVVDVASYSTDITYWNVQQGSEQYTINMQSIPVSDYYTMATVSSINKDMYPASSKDPTLFIQYNASLSSARGYLNYIEITPMCSLQLESNQLAFRSAINYNESKPIRYILHNVTAHTQIWNVTQLDSIYRMPISLLDNTLSVVASNIEDIQQLIAVNVNQKEGWLSPKWIGEVSNQDLHSLSDIDLVIISPSAFIDEAKLLAKAHEEKDQMTVAVVTDEQIYNEFSSGNPDATAYRWIMKMLYDRGINGKHKPGHLLLFGDGTFDNRQLLISPITGKSTGGEAWLLTYQTKNSVKETDAFAMDDYFAFMENNEGESDVYGTMEFGVGRLPINSKEEAQQMVTKITNYLNNANYGKWKNQILFIADDGDNGLHTQTAEAGAEKVRKKNLDFIVNKVYLDAYPQEKGAAGESYPLAKNRIDNLISNGVLYMNYSGHGGFNGITNEGIMNLSSIKNMTNANQGLWMLATCSFSHYDSGTRCAAEEAVLNPNGAAIAVMSACRTVYANQNTIINRNFCDTLFGHKDVFHYDMTIGQSTRIAKNKTGNDANKLAYTLLGDPAIRLNYPTQFNIRTLACADTIHAVSTQELRGEIIDSTGARMTWFNGNIQIWIYDKMQQITTRDNDESSESKKLHLTYNDYPNLLYSGEVAVEKGVFQMLFMSPLDIRYNYGNGRIVYYAYDEVNMAEAIGHYEDFIIGGGSSVAIQDTVGPNMHIYLNNPKFVDGGVTHEKPHFYAELEDNNGINTVGSGIGHDLLLVVDEDPLQTYVLNDYYQVQDGQYTQGFLSYQMGVQAEGQHQLRFRAWDLLNNSTTQYLNYTVIKGSDTELYQVMAYPNPAKSNDQLTIQIDYNRPDELVETHIYFYDMAGRMVHFAAQDDAKHVQCNLAQLGLAPGIYTYQVQVKTKTTSFVTKSSKLIITYE